MERGFGVKRLSESRKRRRGLSANHAAVFDVLKSARRPMTAYELIDVLRPAGITAPPTVYRALSRLIEDGLAHRLESLNAFVACSHGTDHGGPVVFTICNECGTADEFTDEDVTALLRSHAAERDFSIQSAMLELRGRCGACEESS